MRHRRIQLAVAFAALLVVPAGVARLSGQGQTGTRQAEAALEAAHAIGTVKGDLAGAIEQYKRIVSRFGKTERGVAARALLEMADCYEKLGNAEAQKIYAQIGRDYADQKDTVERARAHLASTAAEPPMKGDRSVWTGRHADGFGTISPDGRWLTFTDWENDGALMRRDLVTGAEVRLTSGGSTQFSAISKDGQQVAYEWWVPATAATPERFELRLAHVTASGLSDTRVLFSKDEIAEVAPFDWSADDNWIAVEVRRRDDVHQIGLVSTRDGALRVLISNDWKRVEKIFFSPDGQYIAYDLMPTDERSERHLYVMAVDGHSSSAVVAHPSRNVVMGWSPDGRHVLFSSDRSGSPGLWAERVSNGKAVGEAVLLKPDILSSWSLGLTKAGTMFVWKYASPIYLQTSRVDVGGDRPAVGPATFQQFISSRGRPAWSGDGTRLAYETCDPLGAGPCALWIRAMDTGQLRELKPKLGYFASMTLSRDGRELVTRGKDLRGRNQGLYRVDTETGNATLVPGAHPGTLPQWAPDGKHAYIARGETVVDLDLTSGAERVVARIPTTGAVAVAVSPDLRYVAFEAPDASGGRALAIMTIEGGALRDLMHISATDDLLSIRTHWTLDGRSLAVPIRQGDDGQVRIWRVDAENGTRVKLDIDTSHWLVGDGFSFDRSGTQIAFVANAGQAGQEIRALENFLPKVNGPN